MRRNSNGSVSEHCASGPGHAVKGNCNKVIQRKRANCESSGDDALHSVSWHLHTRHKHAHKQARHTHEHHCHPAEYMGKWFCLSHDAIFVYFPRVAHSICLRLHSIHFATTARESWTKTHRNAVMLPLHQQTTRTSQPVVCLWYMNRIEWLWWRTNIYRSSLTVRIAYRNNSFPMKNTNPKSAQNIPGICWVSCVHLNIFSVFQGIRNGSIEILRDSFPCKSVYGCAMKIKRWSEMVDIRGA